MTSEYLILTGHNIDDPAFYDVIKQETDFASEGAKQMLKEIQEELRKKKVSPLVHFCFSPMFYRQSTQY
jgi:uncharacterized protein YfeS